MTCTDDTLLRPAQPADAAAIAQIYNHYIEHSTATFELQPVDGQEMARRMAAIAKQGCPYIVAEHDGQVAAYGYAHTWKERAAFAHTWETTVYVDRQHMHEGLGLLIMRSLITLCRERGAHTLVACITAENAASISLHQRLGFRQASHFHAVGRKFGRWLDIVDMELQLQP